MCHQGTWASQVTKNPPANAGDAKDMGSIPGSGRSSREGNGNPFQYSYLGNLMDRGAWQATDLEVTKNQTQLSVHAHTHTHTHTHTKELPWVSSHEDSVLSLHGAQV